MDEDEEQQPDEDPDECPDCLCPAGQPGEWEVWLFDCEQIVTYCGCGCHEGMDPAPMAQASATGGVVSMGGDKSRC